MAVLDQRLTERDCRPGADDLVDGGRTNEGHGFHGEGRLSDSMVLGAVRRAIVSSFIVLWRKDGDG